MTFQLYCTNEYLPMIFPATEIETIRGAFNMWEEKTCITFTEVPRDQSLNEHHVFVTKSQDGRGGFVETEYVQNFTV